MAGHQEAIQEMQQEPEVFLGQVVQMVVNTSMVDLRELSNALPTLPDLKRKEYILNFLHRTRHKLLKVLVVVQWATTNIKVLADQHKVSRFLQVRGAAIQSVLGILERGTSVLRLARAPIYDVGVATDILFSGTYLRLPRSIELLAEGEADQEMGETDEKATYQKLNRLLLNKLLKTDIPPQFTLLEVTDGKLNCQVAHEFEVVLRLAASSTEEAVWRVLSIKLRVRGDSQALWEGALADGDETELPEATLAMVTGIEKSGKQRGKILEREQKTIVKQYQMNYLLHLLQLRLNGTEQALGEVYDVVHMFSMSACRQILLDQLQTLIRGTWRNAVDLLEPQTTEEEKSSRVEFSVWPVAQAEQSHVVTVTIVPAKRGAVSTSSFTLQIIPPPKLYMDHHAERRGQDPDAPLTFADILAQSPMFQEHSQQHQKPVHGCKLKIGENGDEDMDVGDDPWARLLAECGLLPSCLNAERLAIQVVILQAQEQLLQLHTELASALSGDKVPIEYQEDLVHVHIVNDASSVAPKSDILGRNSTAFSESYLSIALPWFISLNVHVNLRNGNFLVSMSSQTDRHGESRPMSSVFSNFISRLNAELKESIWQYTKIPGVQKNGTLVERSCDIIATAWCEAHTYVVLEVMEQQATQLLFSTRRLAPSIATSLTVPDVGSSSASQAAAAILTRNRTKSFGRNTSGASPKNTALMNSETIRPNGEIWDRVVQFESGSNSLFVKVSSIAEAQFFLQFSCSTMDLEAFLAQRKRKWTPRRRFGVPSEVALTDLLESLSCHLVCDSRNSRNLYHKAASPQQPHGALQALQLSVSDASALMTQVRAYHGDGMGKKRKQNAELLEETLFRYAIDIFLNQCRQTALQIVSRVHLHLCCLRLGALGFTPKQSESVEPVVEGEGDSKVLTMQRTMELRKSDSPKAFRSLRIVSGLFTPSKVPWKDFASETFSATVVVKQHTQKARFVTVRVDPVKAEVLGSAKSLGAAWFEPVLPVNAAKEHNLVTNKSRYESIAVTSSQQTGVVLEYCDAGSDTTMEASSHDANKFSKAVRYTEWTDVSHSSRHRAVTTRPILGSRVPEPPTTPMATTTPVESQSTLKLAVANRNRGKSNGRSPLTSNSSNTVQKQSEPKGSKSGTMSGTNKEGEVGKVPQTKLKNACETLMQYPLFGLEHLVLRDSKSSTETSFDSITLGKVGCDIDRAARMSLLCSFVSRVATMDEFSKRCSSKMSVICCSQRELKLRFQSQDGKVLHVQMSTPVHRGPTTTNHGFLIEFAPSITPFGEVLAQFLEARVYVGANFEDMFHAVRAFLISVSNLFPCISTIETLVGVQPTILASSNTYSQADEVASKQIAKKGMMLGGKLGLSAQIEAQKAASDKEASSIEAIPLTISNTRFLVGELCWMDIQFRTREVAIVNGGGARWKKALEHLETKFSVPGPTPILDHAVFPQALRSIFGCILNV